MEQPFSKKKTKFRKMINRAKNRFQRFKKIFKRHVVPVVLSAAVLSAVLFGSAYRAYATGMEEFFYYTYFDLISGLFAETGQQFSLKNEFYTNPDRVSGKQVWDNFCTWVENKAKTLALPVEVVNKTVFDEFKDLPNKVTSAGVTMSEKLSELLAKVLPTFADKDGLSDYGDQDATYAFISGIMGITDEYRWSGGTYSMYDLSIDLKNGYDLNVVKYGNYMLAFTSSSYYKYLKIMSGAWGYAIYYSTDGKSYSRYGHTGFTANSATLELSSQDLDSISDIEPVWIMKKGKFTVADGTTVKDYAKVKTVDNNTVYVPGVGYKTNWDIWKDIVNDKATTDTEEEVWNSRYNFDKDNKDDKEKKKKDNEKDKLPVAIPIVFPNKKPDSTEKDTEKDTESDVPGKDPSKNPMINPDTGRYIDPDTGYDIDPDTGKLIDPDTGELIEPDIPSTAGKAGNWKRLFPFCIPWDMMELIKSLKADKKAPVFEFKYTFKAVNYTWVVKVDMSDYWKYIKIFRWGMTIFFIIGLFFLTVKFTTFVQRMGG